MATETVQNSLWGMVKGIVGIGQQVDPSQCRKIKLTTVDAYTLPQTVRAIRVISGGAWVSYKCEDSIVRPGKTMTFDSYDETAVVTALGFRPLVLELTEA